MTAQTRMIISIVGPDRLGLISAVTAELFDLGANLADTSFSVLGAGCEFTCVAEMPADLAPEWVAAELREIRQLDGAQVDVRPFAYGLAHDPSAEITHFVEISGGDRPGLIARLTEVFMEYRANIVRMTSARMGRPNGQTDYITSFAVSIPAERAYACLSSVHNTAGQMQLKCSFETAG